jgi:hypothetical protein
MEYELTPYGTFYVRCSLFTLPFLQSSLLFTLAIQLRSRTIG